MSKDRIENSIKAISEEILTYLLAYKQQNQDFTFCLRTKDSIQSKEQRLEKGYWFQGSNYIFVPLYKQGDSFNKTKTIGFVIDFDKEGNVISNHLELAFGSVEASLKPFYYEVAKRLGADVKESEVRYILNYPDKNYIKNLNTYIISQKAIIDNTLKEFGLENHERFKPTKEEFNKWLNKIQTIKANPIKGDDSTPISIKTKFEEIIAELKKTLPDENSKLSKFQFSNSGKDAKDYWIWLSDNLNKIGINEAHYEIRTHPNNKIVVDIHFEGDGKKRFQESIGNVLPEKIEWIKWFDAKSLRYKHHIDIDSTNVLDEIKEALLYLDNNIGDKIRKIIESIEETQTKMNNKIPLNQILFGPPGTGKTYHTINKALAIVEDKKEEDLEKESRKDLKKRFDAYVAKGQIVFTTFHQSMSYEDFIEGIKPIKPKADDSFVKYEVEDGIFKRICNEAQKKQNKNIVIDNQEQELTKEVFKDFYVQFASSLVNADENVSNCYLKTRDGYEFGLFKNTANSISIKAGQKKTKMSASFDELSSVLFDNKKPTYESYEKIIIDKILEDKSYKEATSDNTQKNYVLIIDEINRGNVSQIFGELITLIEEDKRLGKDEALELILPYSKSETRFGVPPNLYLIGTMNTADRSVEALDTALRRRFSFVEMPPRPELLSPNETLRRFWIKNIGVYYGAKEVYAEHEKDIRDLLGLTINNETEYINYGNNPDFKFTKEEFEMKIKNVISFDGVNLALLLQIINKRIEVLLDRDHQIGHSYFLTVYTIEDLKTVFHNRIVPLLQEYFFGDYGKIGLVLGNGFVKKEESTKDVFFDFEYNDGISDFTERPVYRIKNIMEMEVAEFKEALNKLTKKP
ncbi:MAG: AAA family ATPase [Saprospiraceae bacterium]|nr:AAA family ATPase [Saprospiraceae bacterium]